MLSEPTATNPVTGIQWDQTHSPTGDLRAIVWNNDAGTPAVATAIVGPGVVYDLFPTGVFSLEMAHGIISPEYNSAPTNTAPNFGAFNPSNSNIFDYTPTTGDIYPIYKFVYHNGGTSYSTSLIVTRIDR